MSSPTAHHRDSTPTLLRWRIPRPQFIALTAIVILCLLPFLVRGLLQSTSASRSADRKPEEPARLSDAISVRARGHGNPTINLSDGHDLLTSYVGQEELRVALEQNQAEPLSLASADFDEDGVPDLVSGYGYQGRGIVSLLRGNVDSIYPNAPEAQLRKANGTFTQTSFLSPARVFALPIPADFIGAGDFDGDGHWDIVSASRISEALYLLSGDGRGGFAPAREISLPGVVTAMTTGEVNRRDGLTDVIVGITHEGQSQVVVFEGPDGALKAAPERFNMPAEVGSVALGQLDQRYPMDLAVAAGNELIVLAGRDRKLSLDENQQKTVLPALRSRRVFPSLIRSMTLGDFTGGSRTDVALLMEDGEVQLLSQREVGAKAAARETIETWKAVSGAFRGSPEANQLIATHTSGSPHDDLLIADASNSQLHVLTSGESEGASATAAAVETKRVTSGPLHLTASLDVAGAPVAVLPMRLNVDASSDLVILRRNETALTILASPQRPEATFIVTNTNDSGTGSLRQAILDANASPAADTITFSIGSGAQTITPSSALPTVTGPVTIDGTTQPGFGSTPIIELSGSGVPNGTFGLLITGGSTTVRGLVINRFDGSPGPAIRFQTNGGNVVEGNFIGTDVTGTLALGNGIGVFIDGPSNNRIGGTTAAAHNLISGNGLGIETSAPTGFTTTGNLVQGNFIGTDVAGTADLGNSGNGVLLFRSASVTTIGGTVPGARNIISGNNNGGIGFDSTSGTLVQGNFIGTDVNGTVDLGNSFMGVQLPTANANNTIGGTTPAARNVISGNNINGIQIRSANTNGNLVQGNFIGTNALGTTAIGNGLDGVSIESSSNTIGGVPEARNIISGNGQNGISVFTNTGITVQNNYIGTDATGNNCLGNGRDGIFVNNGSVGHTIADNLITCNGRNGVNIPSVPTNDPGIRIEVTNNFIFANGALGIDLGDPGITPNDLGDGDVGANFLQNFPVLSSFTPIAPGDGSLPLKPDSPEVAITVNATLNSTPNTTFTVHWYFSGDTQCATNQQPGQVLAFGKKPGVTTGNDGNAVFSFPFDFPAAITNGIINCTATDSLGNTSEFSACLPVTTGEPAPNSVQFTSSTANVSETLNATTKVDLNVTRSGNTSGPATVNYASSDGTASERSDYLAALGTLQFAAGETSQTISVFIVDDRFGESGESFNVTLSNPVNLVLGAPASVRVTINSNESVNGPNPVRNSTFNTDFFVRQHYIDFFNREADSGGLGFWKNQIDECTTQACREIRRINVSAAFFVSIEFRETGYLVYKTYQAAYNTGEFLKLRDFLPDLQEIGRGVVIGQPGAPEKLEANKVKFFNDFVQRAKFTEPLNYPTTLTAEQFVDKLNANTFDPRNPGAGALTQAQRDALVTQLLPNPSSATLRALVLRGVSENSLFDTRQLNKAFVLMQYFGYLRRNPNDPPEAGLNFDGYNFWLSKLNQFDGNFVNAEMVKAFITSGEYEQRFGP